MYISSLHIHTQINPECSLQRLMLKLHFFGLLMPTLWKRPSCWERLKAKGEGASGDEMVRQYHRQNGHESEQTLGVVKDRAAQCAAIHGVIEPWK